LLLWLCWRRRLNLTLLRRWRWWLHFTLLRRGRLNLPLLQSLLSRRRRWWLNLTLLRRRWGRLNLRLLRRRLHLTLLWRLRRARPLRRIFLFLLFLICLGRLGDHEHAIEWRGVC
jgi:hypothetical protein